MRRKASATIDDPQFVRFWTAYPKRVAKLNALKAWSQLNPDLETVEQILAAISAQKQQPSWLKDGGQFIPYPASWLRAGRWMDQVEDPRQSNASWVCPHDPVCTEGRWKCEQRSKIE